MQEIGQLRTVVTHCVDNIGQPQVRIDLFVNARVSSGKRHRDRTELRFGITLCDTRGSTHELEHLRHVVDRCVKDRCTHRRSIARREHAGAGRLRTQPEFDARPSGRFHDARRQSQNPPSQSTREETCESIHIAVGFDQQLSHQAGVFGVVRDHATPSTSPTAVPRMHPEVALRVIGLAAKWIFEWRSI